MTLPELLNLYRLALGCEAVNIYKEYNMKGALPSDPIRAEELAKRHARWMMDNMPVVKDSDVYTEVPEELAQTVDDLIKFNRWLGFVQAVLWMTGVYSLDQLRAHIRELQ